MGARTPSPAGSRSKASSPSQPSIRSGLGRVRSPGARAAGRPCPHPPSRPAAGTKAATWQTRPPVWSARSPWSRLHACRDQRQELLATWEPRPPRPRGHDPPDVPQGHRAGRRGHPRDPGDLTPEVIAFGEEVVAAGYTVVMPQPLRHARSAPPGAASIGRSLGQVCVQPGVHQAARRPDLAGRGLAAQPGPRRCTRSSAGRASGRWACASPAASRWR